MSDAVSDPLKRLPGANDDPGATPTEHLLSVPTDALDSLQAVVNMVRTGRAETRPQLSRVTGFGRGLVTQRVSDAIELGLIEDGEHGASTGGRAPRTLRFRDRNGLIAVCALGALHISVALATLNGTVVTSATETWAIANGPEETLVKVRQMYGALRSQTSIPVWGAAIGVPGPVRFDTGVPIAPPTMPGWNGFDVRGRFEQVFDAPVWVDSDVNLRVLGAARALGRMEDVVYLKVGSGVALGLMSSGQLHRGASGAAGDIGHKHVPGSSVPCRCGRSGCFEAVAGGFGLVTQATAIGAAGHPSRLTEILATRSLTPDDIADAARGGDLLAMDLVAESGRVLGSALAAVVDLFNPSLVVLGGSIAESGETFLSAVRRAVYEQALPLATRDLSITTTPRSDDALFGGIELVIDQLFSVSFEKWALSGSPLARTADVY